MTGRSILLVEDELLIRTILTDVLRDAGYSVTEAASGEEALDALSGQAFDLLVTDVKMPGSVDGLKLAAHWRSRSPDRPVLISSAHLRADQAGLCDRLITKPFSDCEFLRTVEELIATPVQSQPPIASF